MVIPTYIFILAMLGYAAAVAVADNGQLWYRASATWYGSSEGDGSDGGACGYGPLVDRWPLTSRVSAVSNELFQNGMGCGVCYKVKCLDRSICSRRAVTITVMDQSPNVISGTINFDLGGKTIGRMALPGQADQLRNRGVLSIIYQRTSCTYGGKDISFEVVQGSTADWLELLVAYEDGPGDIQSMHIKEANSQQWIEMHHVWGRNWCAQGVKEGPFSVSIAASNGKSVIAYQVIPSNWEIGKIYASRVNF